MSTNCKNWLKILGIWYIIKLSFKKERGIFMQIITVSREFGSGGREIGKRIAESLGWTYYDREIISELIKKTSKVHELSEKELLQEYPISFGRTFSSLSIFRNSAVNLVAKEQRVIRSIAKRDENFIIVGRCADIILKKYRPFTIFVYADMPSKIKRCKKHHPKGEKLLDKEIEKKIKQVDGARKKYHDLVSTEKWGDKKNYHLCINTSGIDIKDIIAPVSEYSKIYFDNIKPTKK